MPLPAAVTTAASWSNHKNAPLGPFEYNGAFYAVLVDKTNNHVEVWTSTDGGETWSEADSASHPAVGTPQICTAFPAGDTLYIGYHNPTAFAAHPFSMATNTWGTAVTSTTGAAVNVSGTYPTVMVRRSDGDYVILHNTATETIMGVAYRRVGYSRYEAGTWTTAVDVAGAGVQVHYDARAACLGSSDRVHFFWDDTTNADLKHRSLTAGNVLNTIANVDANPRAGNYPVGLPAVYVDGADTKIVLPSTVGTILYAKRAVSADNPTWTSQTVVASGSGNEPEVANANAGATAVNGTTVHLFWPDDATQDIWRDSDGGTGTWGTDTEWKDAVTCNGISIGKVSYGGGTYIGVLYDDAGTVMFDRFTLTAPPAGSTARRRMHLLGVGH